MATVCYNRHMKKCKRCNETKSLSEFHKNSAKLDGVQTSCKSCRKKENAVHYSKTKEQHVDKRKTSALAILNANRRVVYDYLNSHPCIDCGNTDWRVLEFDHVRDAKEFNISSLIGGYKKERLLAEMEKCDVRCANCHRLVTASRLNSWRMWFE